MELVVVGLSHKTAPVELRERVALSHEETEEILHASDPPKAISERLLLSTCNRTELYGLSETALEGKEHFLDLVRRHRQVDLAKRDELVYLHTGREMVAHLFRVASSIDSMVVGEVQILGQVHTAFELAQRCDTIGPLFHRLLEATFRVGKRVRRETDIAIGAVSVGYAAVTLATRIFSDLPDRTALLVGSGATGELTARHMKDHGIGKLAVCNRTYERAVALAEKLNATAVAFDQLESSLAEASVVVTATASPEPLIRADQVRRVVSGRGNRPLLIVDIGVPRDVEPRVKEVPNVFLYDIDALEGLVAENLNRRRHAIPAVEAIVRHELEQFFDWYNSLEAAPLIRDLRGRYEEIRMQEVARHAKRFRSEDREQLDALTRGMINKLLHQPTVNIRAFQRQGGSVLLRMETVRRLFGLEEGGKGGED